MHKSCGVFKIPDIIQYKQSKIIHYPYLHKHNTRNQNTIYEVKPRHPIGNRLLVCNASRDWNSLPTNLTQQPTHGEYKNDFYNSKLPSYTDSTLNFAPNMF